MKRTGIKRSVISGMLAAVMLAACLSGCAGQKEKPADETAQETEAAAEEQAGPEEQAESEVQAGAEAESAANTAQAAGILPAYTLREYTNSEMEGYYIIAGGVYDIPELTEEAKAAYPGLDASLQAAGAEIEKQAKDQFDEIENAAELYLKDFQDDMKDFPAGDMERKIETVRCDSSVLSFFQTVSTYYPGAAHGLVGYTGYNYDPVTGSQIAITDVVKDLSAMAPAVSENLVTLADGVPFTDVQTPLEEYFDQNSGELSWVIDRDGIVFRFAPYEIAPYAAGTIEARVRFDKYPELFTGKYGAADGAYAKMLAPHFYNAMDLNGDGETEYLAVSGIGGNMDTYTYNTSIQVIAGDRECTVEDSFYSLRAAFARAEDGGSYVYVETTTDNDYNYMHVFEIRDGEPVYVGKMDGTGFAWIYHVPDGRYSEPYDPSDKGDFDQDLESDDWKEDEYSQLFPLLDPAAFALDTRMDLMSTYSAIRFYECGEDGMPSPLTDYYEIDTSYRLTALMDMEVELVDPESGELSGGKTTLTEGTVCSLWRTNGTDTVDLKTEDGQCFRLYVTRGQWPQTVNGIPLEEAFSGVVFAG